MYEERRTQQVKPLNRRGRVDMVTGTSLVGQASTKREPQPPPSSSPAPPAPPSPEAVPPEVSKQMHDARRPSQWVSLDPNSEYMQSVRDQTRAELQNITGRMFQVLNDYEDSTAADSTYMKDYITGIGAQIGSIQNSQLKNDIQLILTDYKNMCNERDELLYSLQDWFEEGHLDSDMESLSNRKLSTKAFKHSLEKGKETSKQLRTVQEEMEVAMKNGENVEHLKREKQRLENELLKSKQAMDGLATTDQTTSVPDNPISITACSSDMWKYAATDICSMLYKVRDTGMEGIKELERKIQEMVSTIENQKSEIDSLKTDVASLTETLKTSEGKNSKLSSDNSVLKEQLEKMRTQLLRAKKANKTKQSSSQENDDKASSTEKKDQGPQLPVGFDVDLYNAQILDLKNKIESLTKENAELKAFTLENEINSSVAANPPDSVPTSSSHEFMSEIVHESADQLPQGQFRSTDQTTPSDIAIPQLQPGAQTHENKFSPPPDSTVAAIKSILAVKEDHQVNPVVDEVSEIREALYAAQINLSRAEEENMFLRKKLEQLQISNDEQIQENDQSNITYQPMKSTEGTTQPGLGVQSYEYTTASTMIKNEQDSENTTSPSDSTSTMHVVVHNNSKRKNTLTQSHTNTASRQLLKDRRASAVSFDRKAATLKLVSDLLQKLNNDQLQNTDGRRDSSAITFIHEELEKVYNAVDNVMKVSAEMLIDEVGVVDSAAATLINILPNKERPPTVLLNEGPTQTRITNEDRDKQAEKKQCLISDDAHLPTGSIIPSTFLPSELKKNVMEVGQEAINALRAGEEAMSAQLETHQHQLEAVFHAMTQHKAKQSKEFTYLIPNDVQEVHMNVETKELTNDSSTEVDPKSVKRSRSYRTGAVYGRASLWQQDNSTALGDPSPYWHRPQVVHNERRVSIQQPPTELNPIEISNTRVQQRSTATTENRARRLQSIAARYTSKEMNALRSTATGQSHRKPKLYKPFHYGLKAPPPRTAPLTSSMAANPRRVPRSFATNMQQRPITRYPNSPHTKYLDVVMHNRVAARDKTTLKLPKL